MEITDIKVTGRTSLTLPWEEIQIMPIGDVQLQHNTQAIDLKRLKKQIQWAKEQEAQGHPPIYFLGMGDYVDTLSPSNRAAWAATRLYDSAREAMEAATTDLEQQFLDIVAGTEGRWLGILQGHHFFQHEDGSTSDTRIAHSLGAPFLGTCGVVILKFPAQRCLIWCHHGAGGGISPMSPINKLLPVMNAFEADIYLIGHHTKKPVLKMPKLYVSEAEPYELFVKNKVLAGTGGFTLGYAQGSRNLAGNPEGGYVERGMLTPTALGSILVKIRPAHEDGMDRLDINVEV